jgi:hypothetical protein
MNTEPDNISTLIRPLKAATAKKARRKCARQAANSDFALGGRSFSEPDCDIDVPSINRMRQQAMRAHNCRPASSGIGYAA